MASTGFPGRELGFGVPEAGGGGLLKRPLSEMERLQLQQQMQQQMFLRSVKQRTLLASSVPPHLSTPPPQDLFLGASSSLSSLNLTASGSLRRQEAPFSAPAAEIGPSTALRDGLQELERRLLLDDEEEDAVSASGSAVTTAEWSEAMQQLIAAPAPAPAVSGANQLSPSPTNSSSSTVSSSASSSPPASLVAAIPSGASLRQMLLDTANAVADGNSDMANANLCVLKSAANYRGDPEQRLTAMMVAVLFVRLKLAPAAGSFLPTVAEVCGTDHLAASQMLYEVSPCFKLGLMAANLAILEATKDFPKIHILDFEVGHGGQYVALIHALVDRHRLRPAGRPPSLRITAVADPASPFTNNHIGGTLRTVGDGIEKLGERHGLSVRFDVVHHRTAELDAAALGCEAGEALAVNLAFSLARIPDESVSPTNPRDELLRRLRALGPRVVVLVEQEINTNTAAFAGRFAAACSHYGALLESLDATAARDSGERGRMARIEVGLARRVLNSVAREGADRVERCEVFGKWRARMGMAGFKPVQLGPALVESVKNRLESMRTNLSFSIAEEANRIQFAWKGQILTVASTWH